MLVPGRLAHQDHKVSKGPREKKVFKESADPKGIVAHREIAVPRANEVQRENKAHLDLRGA